MFMTNTSLGIPSAPRNFRASNITAGNIYLEWDLPLDLGGSADVLGYLVFQKPDLFLNESSTVYDGQDSTVRSAAITGLVRNSSYVFSVAALNAASYCVNLDAQNASSQLVVTTLPYSRLEPPASLFQVSRTGGSVSLGWTSPRDLAGVPLLGYQVARISENGTVVHVEEVTMNVTRYTVFGLSEATSYRFVVHARNENGLGNASAILTVATTAYTSPSAVQEIRVVETIGGQIHLSWDPPQDAGGRAITSYEVARSGRNSSFVTTTTEFQDYYGLLASSTYTYKVRAFNGLYQGPVTFISAATTSATLPRTLVFTTVAAFGGRFEVSWEAPEDVGGASEFEFFVALQDQSRAELASLQTVETNATFGSLTANTVYHVVGKVITMVGGSSLEEYQVITAPVDLPGKPPRPTVSDIRGGSVLIRAMVPAYDGGEAVKLVLYQGNTQVHDFDLHELSWTVYQLLAETRYAFSVAAVNSAGETHGLALIVTTGSISTPGGIVEVMDVEISYNQLLLAWDAVVDTGGDPMLRYQVTYFKCDQHGSPLQGNKTEFTDTGIVKLLNLDHSSFYSVTVLAVTTTGLRGPASRNQIFETEPPFSGRIVVQNATVVVSEGATNVTVPVSRIDGSFGDLTFSYMTEDDTAVAGANYRVTEGISTLPTNVKRGEIVIPIIDDTVYKPNTTFFVLVKDDITTLITRTQVLIIDNGDAGFLGFTSASFAFLENSGEVNLPISRVGGTSPPAIVQAFIASGDSKLASGEPRFEILDPVLRFADGATAVNLRLKIRNDSDYQFIRDSANISFAIVEGGPLFGPIRFTNVSAIDDGDISLPKQSSNLRLLNVSGGYMQLQWTPPLDRGGQNVTLSYVAEFSTGGNLALSVAVTTENETVYGLNASTTYEVAVRAVNRKGSSAASKASLWATTAATRASAPGNVSLLSASSSKLLISWDRPIDNGGSEIVRYKVYNVLDSSGAVEQFPQVSCVVPTVCLVSGLVALTNYTVQVRAATFLVSDGLLSTQLRVQTSNPDVPDPPPLATIANITAGAISIAMHDPLNIGGSAIQYYRLFLMEDDASGFAMIYEGTSPNHTVYRLKRKTAYHIKYQVKNIVGPSAFSAVQTITTKANSLSSAPLNLTVVKVTGGAVELSWDEPLDIGGRDITGYTIMIKSSSPDVEDLVGYDGKRNSTRRGTVYRLTAETMYRLYVLAYTEISSCYEKSEWVPSTIMIVSTLRPTLPGTAPLLLLSRFTGGIIELAWTKPEDTGGVPITRYVLYSVTTAGLFKPLFEPASTDVLAFIDKNLTESTTYAYVVIASNSVGESPPSAVLTRKTTVASPPSAPLNVQQLSYKTGGAVQIGWDRPVDAGGQPLSGYLIYRDGVALADEVLATALSFVDKNNLAAGRRYEYTIRSFSSSSLGSEYSAVCTAATTGATAPQLPRIVVLTSSPSTIQANWSADPDTGGVPITLFEVQLLFDSSVVHTYTGLLSSFTFRSLLANTQYWVSVVAYNDIGVSPKLLVNTTTLNATLPSAPNLPAAISVFGGNFTLDFVSPVDQGGAPITSMTVYEKTKGLVANVVLSAGTTTARYTMYNVLCEKEYLVSVSATSVLGEGPQSPSLTIRTGPASAPGAILLPPLLLGATGTTITSSWLPPQDTGGDPLALSYDVRFVDPSRPDLPAMVFPFLTANGTATGLAYGTSYAVSVRAVNTVGVGEFSLSTHHSTQPDAAGEFNFASVAEVVQVLENARQVSLLVMRENGLSGRVTLVYKALPVDPNPASLGTDFELEAGSSSASSSITFDNLQAAANITVTIINDTVYEHPDETFAIQLVSATSESSKGAAKVGVNTTALVRILDDVDAGYISFNQTAYAFSEGVQIATLTIVREYGSSSRIVLAVTFGNGTATIERDYRRYIGYIVMEDGVTRTDIKVPIINDRVYEAPDEFFFVTINVVAGGAVLKNSTAQVTILDDGDSSLPGDTVPPKVLATTGGSVTLSLPLPTHNGSAKGELSGYIVRLNSSISAEELTISPSATAMLGNLTALTAYEVSFAAVNLAGQGQFSNVTEFATGEVSVPGPIKFVGLRERTGGRIKLYWYAPDDTGGVPISKYRVFMLDPLGLPQAVTTNTLPVQEATVYGLNASTQYSFAVQVR